MRLPFLPKKNRRLCRTMSLIAMLTGLLLLCASCGQKKESGGRVVQVNYLSNAETKVEVIEFEKPSGSAEEQLRILLSYLSTIPKKSNVKSPLHMGFEIISADYQDGSFVLNVDEKYLELSPTTEVLVRAALVRTLLQADGVNRIQIQVRGNQLYDAAGDPVGWMTAEQFIRNDGSEINSYEQIRVKLYFANEAGDKLIAAYREKFYSTNTSLERFVVDEILAGPSGAIEGLYATVSSDTKILSVMTKDGICYLNFDSNFLNVVNNETTEVKIYSIVNSLSELQGVNFVQILVNGEIPDIFENSIFERNMDIVTTMETTQE
ncbi:MAG: GerMN domain-containing protein [Acetatifactor sp.]|nr:GerMN domain-containing protein [Acetatifactor sp.]